MRPYPYAVDWRSRITIEAGKRGGKPCIRGLRMTVSEVLEYLASGMTEDKILQDFPDLTARTSGRAWRSPPIGSASSCPSPRREATARPGPRTPAEFVLAALASALGVLEQVS
jgi:uncharacterized protein (DUF433 family)